MKLGRGIPVFDDNGDKMKALILGGNGFIGSYLVDSLADAGWRIRVLDQAMERFRKPRPDVDYIIGNYGEPGLIDQALEGVETVFHCVSTTLPNSSNKDPIFDVNSNLVATITLLEHCVKQGIRKVVFLSSGGSIYGLPRSLPITEEHPTEPMCSYGICKLAIEKYLYLFQELHGIDYQILRPANPYGPRQNPNGTQGAIAVFLGLALRNQPIEIWGDGQIVRDYFHVKDLAAGIHLAATAGCPSSVFNLGSGRGYSLTQIVAAIQDVTGRRLVVNYAPQRVFDPPSVVLDIRRAENLLGWAPRIPLEEGIGEMWDHMQRCELS